VVADRKRWDKAQGYEKRHWERAAKEVAGGMEDLEWYRTRAERVMGLLDGNDIHPSEDSTVAEIGSGPVGIIGFLPGKEKYAIDPLMAFYDSENSLTARRDPAVRYIEAKGENIPIPEAACDLVVIDNCLDHCEDPGKVLDECRRILKGDGHLYLTLNVRNAIGWVVRNAMEVFEIDPGHPHSYYAGRLRRLIAGHGFFEQGFWLQPWSVALSKEWNHNRRTTTLKVLSFTMERLATGIWSTA
jgi:SAM-dependent methyltransferase